MKCLAFLLEKYQNSGRFLLSRSIYRLIISALVVKFLSVLRLNPTPVVSVLTGLPTLSHSNGYPVLCNVCFRTSWSKIIMIKQFTYTFVCQRSSELLSSCHPDQWHIETAVNHLIILHLHSWTEVLQLPSICLALVLTHLAWLWWLYRSRERFESYKQVSM